MKKKSAVMVFVIMTLVAVLVPQLARAYPTSQGRLVNDFVGVFSQVDRDRLESKLREHEKQTTNEVAVVVLRELDGEDIDSYAPGLFKSWGIGKKGKDNGILILVATDVPGKSGGKGRRRIEVGYGLEGVLPDSKAGEILRHNRPAFDQGKIAESIEGIADDVLKVITPVEAPKLSPDEAKRQNAARMAAYNAKIEKQKREKERNDKIGDVFATVLLVLFSIAALGFGGWWITKQLKKLFQERRERREKRDELSGLITSIKEDLDRLRNYPDNTVKKFAAEPVWVRVGAEELGKKLRRLITEAETKFRGVIGGDWHQVNRLDENIREMRRSKSIIGQAKEVVEDIGEWPKEVEQLKKRAAEYVAAAKQDRTDLIELIGQMRAEGYRVDLFPESIADTSADHLNEMEEDINHGHDPREIQAAAERMTASFSELSNQVHGLRAIKSANDEHAKRQSGILEKLRSDLTAIRSVYTGIQNGNPKSAWSDLVDVGSYEERFKAVTELLAEAEQDNSLAKQDFETAKTKIEAASREISKIRTQFNGVREREQEIAKARSGFHEMLGRAKSRLQEARNVAQSPDVMGAVYRDRLQNVELQIAEAKTAAEKTGLIDWLIVAGMILTAEATAADILKEAQVKIAEAVEARALAKRRKEKEEDERRRQREEDDDRRRRNSYSSSSYSSGSDSSSSSGGGFSFGGGSSGGGGASD